MTKNKFDLHEVELIFKYLNLNVFQIIAGESTAYSAQSFQLGKINIEFRVSKITPKKIGQFVAIWKRNEKGITCPFDVSDDFDFFILASQHESNFGIFIFPKLILKEKGIISENKVGGKNGTRIYPSWDNPTNKQAIKTKNWQTEYFIDFGENQISNLEKAKQLLNLRN